MSTKSHYTLSKPITFKVIVIELHPSLQKSNNKIWNILSGKIQIRDMILNINRSVLQIANRDLILEFPSKDTWPLLYFFYIFLEFHVEYSNCSIQPTHRRRVWWTLQSYLWVRIWLLEDCHISIPGCWVSNLEFFKNNFLINNKDIFYSLNNAFLSFPESRLATL